MTTGTRVAIGFLLFALGVLAILFLYGRGSQARRGPDSPAAVAREMLQADNTVVGMIGGVREFETLALTATAVGDSQAARLEARVLGARDSGRLTAELMVERGRWSMRRARFTLSDGTTIPVAGSAGR
ncbi:MAG TPA: hypothetical protein VJ788_10200 [Gemmatimonadota bacterium]|nr:hypothetical protein [Gemmatimonadota bacterium]